ncbi:hypothetical protein APA_2662 [Pseudanabaena sp. lw0831]|nr:hypothetical protein [Pseudanabaena sp. lw0831]GBO51791.1 hypothetical protein APA_2662 [Pseudanabaena sp. lw0831]
MSDISVLKSFEPFIMFDFPETPIEPKTFAFQYTRGDRQLNII